MRKLTLGQKGTRVLAALLGLCSARIGARRKPPNLAGLVLLAACLLATTRPRPAGGAPEDPIDETDYPTVDPDDPNSQPGSTTLQWPPNMVVAASTFGSLPGAGSVDAAGQYTYRIPIDVPPGRLGMQPHLDLVYSSGAGNDLLGVGWSLSGLSVIAPCLQRHATDQIAWFGAKCWNGKRLVEVPGTDPREYRTEEESFARIREKQNKLGYTVETKDGRKLVFNRKFEGIELAAALLVEESDQRGNGVHYQYDVVSSGEYYPREITYTHRGDEAGKRRVRFEYQARPGNDAIEAYSEGELFRTARLLKSITAQAPNPETTATVWRYELDYDVSPTSKRALLSSVVRVDHLGGRTLRKELHWTSTEGPGYDTPVSGSGALVPGISSVHIRRGYLIADFDQDGADDILFQPGANQLIHMRYSFPGVPLGGERVLPYFHSGPLGAGNFALPDLEQARVGDVNGDGYPDVIAPTQLGNTHDYVLYLWNPGLGDLLPAGSVEPYLEGGDPTPLFLVDLDGDGLPDIVKGYDPTVSGDPNEQQWIWYSWGARLNDRNGGFESPIWLGQGHALGGNEPPFFGYSASDSTGRSALFAMSTKTQTCSVTETQHCYWLMQEQLESDFDPHCTQYNPDCTWVCDPPTTTYSANSLGHDFGVSLSFAGEYPFGSATEDHTLRSVADMNGDGIDDVVTFRADTNEACIRAWGTGGALFWLDEPLCVKVETGRDPEPAEYLDETGSNTHCGYKTLIEPAPWRLRVWDVDGDGRHDLVVQHLAEDPNYPPEDNVYRPDGELYRVSLDATGTLKSGVFPLGNAGPYQDVGSVVGDFDGDGGLDLLVFGPSHMGELLLRKERTADLLTGVMDQNAAREAERVEYSTQWGASRSNWPRDPSRYPLYISDPSDPDENFKVHDPMFPGHYPVKMIRRGLNVVRKHDVYQGDDINAYVHHEYTYADPTFDLRGRGFLGFRVVDHYMPDVPSEEVTFYDNFHSDYDPVTNEGGVYLGAMRPVEVIRMTPILDGYSPGGLDLPLFPARVSRLTSTYKRAPGMTARSSFIHLATWQYREWEQSLRRDILSDPIPRLYYDDPFDDEPKAAPAESHATSPIKTLLGEQTYDDLGNLTEDHVVNPQGRYRMTKAWYHPPDLAHWRLGLMETQHVAVGSLGHPVQFRRVGMEYDAGLLWKVHVEKNDPDPSIPSTVTIDRNTDGSVIKITRSADGVPDRFDTFEYDDSEQMFVTRAANALGHASTALTHPAYGVVVATRDPNNVLTTRQINDRGMVTRVQRAGSAAAHISYADRASNGIIVSATSSADASQSITEYDLRGRPIETRRTGFGGSMIYTKSLYDKLGREIIRTLPAYGQPSASDEFRTFDSLGRLLSVSPPGGFSTTYEHTFLTTEVTTPGDPDTKTRITRDLDGRVTSSEQYDADSDEWLETKYLYAEFDLLWKIIDPKGNETTFEHDKLGRRILSDEPDAGKTTTEYDGLGNITKRVVAGSVTEYTERDALGRLWQQVNDDGVTTFTWDTKPFGTGKVAQSVSPDNVVHDFTYDTYSRPKTETWTIDGAAFSFVNAYDIHGRLKVRTYPTSAGGIQVKIRDHYNAFGYRGLVDGVNPITQTTTAYWRTFDVAATGGITHGRFGNGVVAQRTYEPDSGRLESLRDVNVLFQSFTYDVGGRVASVEDGAGRREEYTYDSLARLSTWTLFPKGLSEGNPRVTTFRYDELGNLLSEDIDDAGQLDTIVHSSGVSPFGPHTPAGAHVFDARGRLVNPNGHGTTYTEFDLPRQIGETHFRYDAEGTRVSKVGPTGTQLTLGGLYERRIDTQGTTDVYMVPGPEGVVAQIAVNPALPDGGHVTYVHGARKGSVHATSTAAGSAATEHFYDPFGARVDLHGHPLAAAPGDVNIGFNGLDHDDELGLINQRGRVYNPSLRRFLTPDPIIADLLNGQTYNPYSYVRNDPVNRIDPSGYCDMSPCGGGFFEPGGGWSPTDHTGPGGQYTSSTGPGIDQTAGRTFTTSTTTRQAAPAPPVSIGINDQTATPVRSTSLAAAIRAAWLPIPSSSDAAALPVPLPWEPPGGQPIPFYLGNQAHRQIAEHYVAQHPGDRVFTNTTPISSIAAHFEVDSAAAGGLALLRPDIYNASTGGETYEIKMVGSETEALAQAQRYVEVFNTIGVPARLGSSTAAGTSGYVAAPGGVYTFSSPVNGVITYRRIFGQEYLLLMQQHIQQNANELQATRIDPRSVAVGAGAAAVIGGTAFVLYKFKGCFFGLAGCALGLTF